MLMSLQVTTVTFSGGKVRVVQATCNPSDKWPRLILALRAIYDFGKKTYNKKTAFEVMQWILSPPEARPDLEGLPIRSKKLSLE
ncbi:hypothetical protein AJ80_09821 [Polytolypa hystricis UAMH7299]|uniref:Uncharacterized protein n=1 Tax=Polytolypa hystricis (strain UAMH7299) TaxID=1447883 RepID=A0A2B7WIZ8_POLH7|nr:hypothetical protein AJ80_09821 [Polytolypa hystricis UAMH7299]